MMKMKRANPTGRDLSVLTNAAISTLLFAVLTVGASSVYAQESDPPEKIEDPVIAELVDMNRALAAELAELRLEVAKLRSNLAEAERARDDLAQFIEDHDTYGPAFEEYTFFRLQKEREAKERRAEELKREREERAQRARELREQRRREREEEAAEREPDEVLRDRMQALRRAGFTAIGDAVAVGHMGYSYRTTEEEELHYSPWLDLWYWDEDEEVDYSVLTLSGTVVHAADGVHNLSIAIAFMDHDGKQIGTTTVQVNGARPGVPYPFTSEVAMAANVPFRQYRAWVLYLDPVSPGPMPEEEGGVDG